MRSSHSIHVFAATPSAAQRAIRNKIQVAHVRELWIFLGSVLAFFTVVNFFCSLWSALSPIPKSRGFSSKEKFDEETNHARLKQSTSQRSLSALTTGFRIVFFRWSVPIGPSAVASITELSFTFMYIVAMLVWLLVDSKLFLPSLTHRQLTPLQKPRIFRHSSIRTELLSWPRLKFPWSLPLPEKTTLFHVCFFLLMLRSMPNPHLFTGPGLTGISHERVCCSFDLSNPSDFACDSSTSFTALPQEQFLCSFGYTL